MSKIYIDVDIAVELFVNQYPLIDDIDFKSPEVAIAYNEAGMDLVWNFTTSAGVVTQTVVTPTTAGNYDWTHVGKAQYKIEIPASGGAGINNDTEGTGFFTGICNGVLAWKSHDYCFRAAALNNALIDGGDLLDVNITHIANTAQTGNDNGADLVTLIARLTAARAGYLDELAAANLPTDITAIIGYVDALETRLTAVRASYLDNLNGHTPQTADHTTAIADLPNNSEFAARTLLAANYFDSTADLVDLNPDQSGATIGTVNKVTGLVAGSGGISTAAESFTATTAGAPTNDYTDTRTEDGVHHIVPSSGADTDIYYQFDIGNSGVPQTVTWIGYAQSNGDSYKVYGYNYGLTTYEQIGTITAANGTSQMTGTFDLLTDHVGIGANAGKVRFRVLSADGTNFATDRLFCTYTQATSGIPNGSTITLAAASTNENYIGNAWNLVLGTQIVSGSFVSGAISISGTATIANGNPFIVVGSVFGTGTVTLDTYAILSRVTLPDTLVLVSTSGGLDDRFRILNSFSGVEGGGASVIDASGLTKTANISNRSYSGGCTYSLNSFGVLSHDVVVGGTVTLTNAAGTAEIRGKIKAFILTSSGAATTNLVCEPGTPITVNGTGGTLNIYGLHGGITDNSGAAVTINQLGADITDIPTNAELNARTIPSADYFDPAADTVALVTNLTNKAGFSLAATGLDLITQSATGVIEFAKAFWDRVLSKSTHNIGQSGAKMLRELGTLIAAEGVVTGTPTTTSVATNITGYDDNFFIDQVFTAYNGSAQAGQGRVVAAYNGTSGVFTFDEPFTTALIGGDDVVVLTPHVHRITEIQGGLATEAKQDTILTKLPFRPTKGAAFNNFKAFMVLASDSKTGAPGLTVSGLIQQGTGSYAALTNSIVEIGNGMYRVNLTAAEMNADSISLIFTAATADARVVTMYTQTA